MAGLFPEYVETDRLAFEPLTTEYVDVREYYRICSGQADEGDFSEVTNYLAWSAHEHPKETRDFLDRVERRLDDGEGIEYVVRPRDGEPKTGAIAGAAGLSVDWDRRLAEFGTWLRRPFWGRGYSGERAAAFVEIVFDYLDLEAVAVTHEVGNEKSQRAIEKYVEAHGGRHEGLLRNYVAGQDGRVTDQRRYTITREEYQATNTPDVGTQVEF